MPKVSCHYRVVVKTFAGAEVGVTLTILQNTVQKIRVDNIQRKEKKIGTGFSTSFLFIIIKIK